MRVGPFEGSGVTVNNDNLCRAGHRYILGAWVEADREYREAVLRIQFEGGDELAIHVVPSDKDKVARLLEDMINALEDLRRSHHPGATPLTRFMEGGDV